MSEENQDPAVEEPKVCESCGQGVPEEETPAEPAEPEAEGEGEGEEPAEPEAE